MTVDKGHRFDPAEDEAILDDWLRIVPEGTAQAVRLYPHQRHDGVVLWLLGELPDDVLRVHYAKGATAKHLAAGVAKFDSAAVSRFAFKLVGSPPGVVKRLPVLVVDADAAFADRDLVP